MTRTSAEVRRAFLDFFESHEHKLVPSSTLVPQNDPTLMFVNAGMVQFKDVFVGKEVRSYRRATSSQKVIRISGKHNDLENVGVTARHHTFFEMLGNFSFGDYFKEAAIAYAWELLTRVYGLSEERLVITVFGGAAGVPADDEARSIWRKVTGFSDDRIIGIPGVPGDNFWQMGETGPCGPCTEIHWFNGDASSGVPYGRFGDEPTADGLGWTELWNLVFMQFDRSIEPSGDAKLAALPKPCVDTGAGLERMASVLQGVTSNYDTDAAARAGGEGERDKRQALHPLPGGRRRLDAGHRRPRQDDRVPDRRRGLPGPWGARVRAPTGDATGDPARPSPRDSRRVSPRGGARSRPADGRPVPGARTAQGAHRERGPGRRGAFPRDHRARPRDLIEKNSVWRTDGGRRIMPGATAFKLSDTFGFPLDLTQVIGQERGFEVDVEEYERAMQEQRARSEGSKVGDEAIAHVWREVLLAVQRAAPAGVKFVGYEREESEGRVVAILSEGKLVDRVVEGQEAILVADVTPFYGEAGGQAGDAGVIEVRGVEPARFQVVDTQKPLAGVVAHHGRVEKGAIGATDAVHLVVDHERRTATRRNHSATHLLHWALRTVLGDQATQKGSLVSADRLRFDFSHGKALSSEEIGRVEDLVNGKVLTAAPVLTEVLPIEEARKRGAVAIFEEKYGDVVRVLTMTKDSIELCGGTHARSLGEIGLFKIVSEQGLAAGVRRIEAATGMNALAYVRGVEGRLAAVARAARASVPDVADKVEKLVERDRQLERQVADLSRKLAMGTSSGGGGGLEEMLRAARDVPGGKALAVRVSVDDAATLREMAEKLRDRLGEAVVLVGAVGKDRAMLVLTVSRGLTDRYRAGDLIKGIAQVLGGSGGGRPDMAQAGGTQIDKLDEALDSLFARLA